MYKFLLRPILFRLDPETAHKITFKLSKLLFSVPGVASLVESMFKVEHPSLERTLFGLQFKNPVGLAAGLDKNAELIDAFAAYGFGFIEIGTITPKEQAGNDKPRLFRLLPDKAIINRMGFNNNGVKQAVYRLKKRKSNIIVGGNIGKNKITPNEEALNDYLICFKEMFDYVDYFVVNVSSPNTPNLRALQEKEPLEQLLKGIVQENKSRNKPKPVLLKIAPDLTTQALDDIIDIVQTTGIDGVIATNTTVSRENLKSTWEKVNNAGAGGLSGAPVKDRSTEVIRYLHQTSKGSFPIIGVGGIMTPEDAAEKLAAGASLIQVYTGFVYEGPALVKAINTHLIKKGSK